MKFISVYLFLFLCFFSYSQENKYKDLDVLIMIKGDSIPSESINLKEITVFPSIEFKNIEDKIKYYIIKRKTLKVYPYAILASKRLTELNKRLPLIKNRARKKKYTKIVERYIEKEFSDELKKLTRTEGQILIKLVHRETGETVYRLIKKLRNGFRAFSYSSLAKLFNISLKEAYDPINIVEDVMIEDVIKRAYADKSIKLSLKKK
ncbi:MAG: DUF4294 domain-containing protein [Flavobacteriaceae bacterium]|nr:DUF4294 domain-containing protein [Flavobacteriaceae bacterium]MBT5011985.1 DUF4294 domain-containing protein [Flavobacteriaceae bacterium]MBT5395743.1 DUF4294 domain-containing protein [Flavobacteriaceae bacterium]MBT6688329.1 DUF4294 domain-containing protein [Flavobacteriaceae bacterium]